MKKQGIEITNSDSYSEPRMAAVLSQRAKFQDLFERYCEIRENEPEICFTPNPERVLIETKNPLVREAYEKIGAAEVRKMKYRQSNIKRRLIAESQKNFAVKVVEMLDLALKKQTWIPSGRIVRTGFSRACPAYSKKMRGTVPSFPNSGRCCPLRR